jgi:hypothetical protein
MVQGSEADGGDDVIRDFAAKVTAAQQSWSSCCPVPRRTGRARRLGSRTDRWAVFSNCILRM